MNQSHPAVQLGGNSSDAIRDIFAVHFPPRSGKYSVLDLTFGHGKWWNWDWNEALTLKANDLNVGGLDFRFDVRAPPVGLPKFDVVCFDPPFSAMGPSKTLKGFRENYGAVRGPDLKNVMDVRLLLCSGIQTAVRLARLGVIVKTQDVVESGENNSHVYFAEKFIGEAGWEVVDKKYLAVQSRPQPPGRRTLHFRSRPSVFLVGKP